jgi:hypothetical protein
MLMQDISREYEDLALHIIGSDAVAEKLAQVWPIASGPAPSINICLHAQLAGHVHVSSSAAEAPSAPCSSSQDTPNAKEHRKHLYTMLWNHSTLHFRSKNYGSAAKILGAAFMYADISAKPVVARQLALCKMGESDLDRYAVTEPVRHSHGQALLCLHISKGLMDLSL